MNKIFTINSSTFFTVVSTILLLVSCIIQFYSMNLSFIIFFLQYIMNRGSFQICICKETNLRNKN
jgi:hypothetical protein